MILWHFTIHLELLDNYSRYTIYPLSALLLSGAPLTKWTSPSCALDFCTRERPIASTLVSRLTHARTVAFPAKMSSCWGNFWHGHAPSQQRLLHDCHPPTTQLVPSVAETVEACGKTMQLARNASCPHWSRLLGLAVQKVSLPVKSTPLWHDRHSACCEKISSLLRAHAFWLWPLLACVLIVVCHPIDALLHDCHHQQSLPAMSSALVGRDRWCLLSNDVAHPRCREPSLAETAGACWNNTLLTHNASCPCWPRPLGLAIGRSPAMTCFYWLEQTPPLSRPAFTIQKRRITSTLRFRLMPHAVAFLAIKNLFAEVHLAWSVPHGIDLPFCMTAITCCLPAMSAPSWHDRSFACMYFSQTCSVCALLGGTTDSGVRASRPYWPNMRAQVSAASLAQTHCICLHPNSPLWPNTCSDLWSFWQVNPLIPFASPLDLSSQTHSLGSRLIVDSTRNLPYRLHSIHLQAFALAHPGADSVGSSRYDSCWHPESLPSSIVAMSCHQSFSLPSLLWVWVTWINQACFQWTADHCLPTAPSKASLVPLYCCTSILVCPFKATTKVWPHAWVPSNLFVIDLEAASGKLQLPSHPNFWRLCLLHLFSSSTVKHTFSASTIPQMQGRPTNIIFLPRLLHFTLYIWKNYIFVLVSLADYRPCYIANDRTLCHLHPLHRLEFMINGCIDFLPVWDYQHPSRRLLTPFSMLIANSLFVDCYFFALFCLGPSLNTIPHSPLHTLLSEGRLLSWYSNLDINILAYYYAV